MRLEIVDDDYLSIWRTSGIERNQKNTVLVELEQAILDTKCKMKIVAEITGVIQIIGAIGTPY